MRKYDLAIFDLDGTILDTLEDLAGSTNAALAESGYPARTVDEVRRFVGNGIRKLIQRAVPEGTSPEGAERALAAFRAHYAEHSMDATRPYPGIPEMLSRLRAAGLRLAVVSNKVDEAVKVLCGAYFPGIFDEAVGERPGIRKKPAPDAVDAVLASLGAARDRAAYIGDSDVDILTAQNAGMDGLIVTWGFRDAAFLKEKGARRLLDTPAELYDALTAEG